RLQLQAERFGRPGEIVHGCSIDVLDSGQIASSLIDLLGQALCFYSHPARPFLGAPPSLIQIPMLAATQPAFAGIEASDATNLLLLVRDLLPIQRDHLRLLVRREGQLSFVSDEVERRVVLSVPEPLNELTDPVLGRVSVWVHLRSASTSPV